MTRFVDEIIGVSNTIRRGLFLYLPPDWRPGEKYPILVEYPGNGGYRNALGDICTGKAAPARLELVGRRRRDLGVLPVWSKYSNERFNRHFPG